MNTNNFTKQHNTVTIFKTFLFFLQLANTLLEIGVDPARLSLEEGDTPNHAALNIGLNKTPGITLTISFKFY